MNLLEANAITFEYFKVASERALRAEKQDIKKAVRHVEFVCRKQLKELGFNLVTTTNPWTAKAIVAKAVAQPKPVAEPPVEVETKPEKERKPILPSFTMPKFDSAAGKKVGKALAFLLGIPVGLFVMYAFVVSLRGVDVFSLLNNFNPENSSLQKIYIFGLAGPGKIDMITRVIAPIFFGGSYIVFGLLAAKERNQIWSDGWVPIILGVLICLINGAGHFSLTIGLKTYQSNVAAIPLNILAFCLVFLACIQKGFDLTPLTLFLRTIFFMGQLGKLGCMATLFGINPKGYFIPLDQIIASYNAGNSNWKFSILMLLINSVATIITIIEMTLRKDLVGFGAGILASVLYYFFRLAGWPIQISIILLSGVFVAVAGGMQLLDAGLKWVGIKAIFGIEWIQIFDPIMFSLLLINEGISLTGLM